MFVTLARDIFPRDLLNEMEQNGEEMVVEHIRVENTVQTVTLSTKPGHLNRILEMIQPNVTSDVGSRFKISKLNMYHTVMLNPKDYMVNSGGKYSSTYGHISVINLIYTLNKMYENKTGVVDAVRLFHIEKNNLVCTGNVLYHLDFNILAQNPRVILYPTFSGGTVRFSRDLPDGTHEKLATVEFWKNGRFNITGLKDRTSLICHVLREMSRVFAPALIRDSRAKMPDAIAEIYK